MLVVALMAACTASTGSPTDDAPSLADVVGLEVLGSERAYTFAVEVRSPDTGCDRYADWWEVVGYESGELVHRRILGHSHVDEQPFIRSSGPVVIEADERVVVRAHLAPGGFGGQVFIGSPNEGFSAAEQPNSFAAELETSPPQPDGCAF